MIKQLGDSLYESRVILHDDLGDDLGMNGCLPHLHEVVKYQVTQITVVLRETHYEGCEWRFIARECGRELLEFLHDLPHKTLGVGELLDDIELGVT